MMAYASSIVPLGGPLRPPRAKKSWGQNFLRDPEVLCATIAAAQIGPDVPVVELGAGLGALTRPALATGAKVIAIERDRELAPHLRALAQAHAVDGQSPLTVLEADAAHLQWPALHAQSGALPVVLGNLPYQLSSRIIVALSEAHHHMRRAVVLVQLEVAERLVARPVGRTYGLLSVLVQQAFDARIIMHVAPEAFVPAPKVQSALVALTPNGKRRDVCAINAARAAFAQRRKTLRNTLTQSLGRADSAGVLQALKEADIEPTARAETLSGADFVRLGRALATAGLL